MLRTFAGILSEMGMRAFRLEKVLQSMVTTFDQCQSTALKRWKLISRHTKFLSFTNHSEIDSNLNCFGLYYIEFSDVRPLYVCIDLRMHACHYWTQH